MVLVLYGVEVVSGFPAVEHTEEGCVLSASAHPPSSYYNLKVKFLSSLHQGPDVVAARWKCTLASGLCGSVPWCECLADS